MESGVQWCPLSGHSWALTFIWCPSGVQGDVQPPHRAIYKGNKHSLVLLQRNKSFCSATNRKGKPLLFHEGEKGGVPPKIKKAHEA